MLTEEMLAATLDGLDQVDRLILCGDPRQLPPIGAGRPFADMVAFREAGRRRAVASFEPAPASRRERGRRRTPARRCRGRLAFSWTPPLPRADEALARVISGGGDGRVEIHTWVDEPDLHRKPSSYSAAIQNSTQKHHAAQSVARSAPSARRWPAEVPMGAGGCRAEGVAAADSRACASQASTDSTSWSGVPGDTVTSPWPGGLGVLLAGWG